VRRDPVAQTQLLRGNQRRRPLGTNEQTLGAADALLHLDDACIANGNRRSAAFI